MEPDPFDHPDLRDSDWVRQAERSARRGARKGRREDKRIRRRQVEIWGGAPKRRRRFARPIVIVAAVLALAGGGIYYLQQARDEQQPAGANADLPTPGLVDLDRPFAATPAHDWADGAAGITVPEAVAVGGFSAEQVGEAYATVKELVVASRLDTRMLERGDVEPFLGLLAEGQREELREQFAAEEWPSGFATRIAPGFRLLDVEPKVEGTMTAEPGDQPGSLRVRTNHVFAYAFDVADPRQVRAPLDIVAVLRADVSYVLLTGGGWYPEDLGYRLEYGDSFGYSIACGPMLEGLLAPSYHEEPELGLPSGKRPPEYFDHSLPMPNENTCGTPQAG
ncbi:hypothetical protein [Prauserella cavernicola]|uniref:Uncharacterized protein n=1 Tax=Prauserella cavernicola TaxID=2800127 RepID=A0A934QSK8_9PSEU|nr:hypothetical protein [Prauserella cavernicola]MBK1785565.1 hypothetical protein [Prauserella cavernicola]